MADTATDDVMTPDQLAQRWGMAAGTLRNWRAEGKGPRAIRLGDGPRARVVYRVADVLAWEDQQKGAAS
jgi:predicted DNA-binding transcriptional regulator AlpA